MRDTVWVKRVAPKARVMWGQKNPEGNECPNGVAGCSNTALAMALLGLRYPSKIVISYESPSQMLYLDWEELAKHRSWDGERDNIRCVCSSTNLRHLAQLCRQLGHMSNTTYYDYGNINLNVSGTATINTINTVKTLGLNHYYDNVAAGKLSENMNVESMVLVRGTRIFEGKRTGHMWLCDGTRHYKIRSRYYRSYDAGKSWVLKATDYSQEYIYNMFNWGWNGYCNGYFLDMDFNANPEKRDGSYKFNIDVQFVSIWK